MDKSAGETLDQKRYRDLILRMECAILNNDGSTSGKLSEIPIELLETSPLLLRMCAVKALQQGRLQEAQKTLRQCIKGFALQTLQRQFLESMALLATVCIHAGHYHEAEVMLVFLHEEYVRDREAMPGLVIYALARGAHFIGERGNEALYFQTAGDRFIAQGDLRNGCRARIDELFYCGPKKNADEWEQALHFFRHCANLHPQHQSYLYLALGIKHFYDKRWDSALKSLLDIDMASLDYDHASLARLLRCRTELSFANPFSGEIRQTVDAILETCKEDLILQGYAYLTLFELLMHERREEEAKLLIGQSKAMYRLNRSYCHAAWIEQMEKQLQVQNKKVPSVNPSWRIQGFGKMRMISKEGQEIHDISWKRKKTRELFLYLLLQPHYSASKEVIIDQLFQQDQPHAANNQLYVIVHQLKQVLKSRLGVEQGVMIKDGCVQLKDDFIEYVDVEKYLHLIRIGNQLWPDDRELSVELYDEAVQLYGELVPEIQYVSWLDGWREQLADKQAAMLARLGQHALAQNRLDRAETYFLDWIRVKPYQEEAYQQLLKLLKASGQMSEAKAWYKKWEKMCWDEWGTAPMRETLHILKE